MRVHGVAIGAALALGAAWPAAAEPPLQMHVEPGSPLALAVETGSHADCTVGPPPDMRVVVAPTHGKLALGEGNLRRVGSQCPAAPGYVVVYVPDDDFTGADMVTIEVSDETDGPMTLAFDIQVKGKVSAPVGGV